MKTPHRHFHLRSLVLALAAALVLGVATPSCCFYPEHWGPPEHHHHHHPKKPKPPRHHKHKHHDYD